MKQTRWNNIGLWLSIASLLYLVLGDLGIEIAAERYDKYVESISAILVMAGILSNPKDGIFYMDSKDDK